MKKILITIVTAFTCVFASAQLPFFQPYKINAQFPALKADKLYIPTGSGAPTAPPIGTKWAGVYYDSTNSKFYVYNPKEGGWGEPIGGGNVTGGNFLSGSISTLQASNLDSVDNFIITNEGKRGILQKSNKENAPDNAIFFEDNSGNLFERIFDGPVNVQWFGAVPDLAFGASVSSGTDNHAAFVAAINLAYILKKNVFIPSGEGFAYRVNGVLPVLNGVSLLGEERGRNFIGSTYAGSYLLFTSSTADQNFLCTEPTLYGAQRFENITVGQSSGTKALQDAIRYRDVNGGGGGVHLVNCAFDGIKGAIQANQGNTYIENGLWYYVEARNCGGAIRSVSQPTHGVHLLHYTGLNIEGFYSVGTMPPSDSIRSIFDLRYSREVAMRNIITQGSVSPRNIISVGADAPVTVDGLHVEFTTTKPHFIFNVDPTDLSAAGTNYKFENLYSATADSAMVRFSSGSNTNFVKLINVTNYDITSINGVRKDYGAGNKIEIDGLQFSGLNLDISDASNVSLKNLNTQYAGIRTTGVEVNNSPLLFDYRGGLLDGLTNKNVFVNSFAPSISAKGVYNDATQGRIYTYKPVGNDIASVFINIASSTDLIGKKVTLAVRYKFSYAGTGTPTTQWIWGGDFAGLVLNQNRLNEWATAIFSTTVTSGSAYIYAAASGTLSAPVDINIASITAYIGDNAETASFGVIKSTEPLLMHGTAAPTAGNYVAGDIVVNKTPSSSASPYAWRNITGGSPGTWEALTFGTGGEVTQSALNDTAASLRADLGTYQVHVARPFLGAATAIDPLDIDPIWVDSLAKKAISLTTTGTSGAATYNNVTGVLNIPQYTGEGGGVTSINGETGAVTGYSKTAGTETLTNKRITRRIGTTASGGTITIAADTYDQYNITALAEAATIAAPTGTPTDGQSLMIRIKDNGTARALTWNAIFRASTDFALPTTTVINKTMYVQVIWNAADSKFDAVGYTNGF